MLCTSLNLSSYVTDFDPASYRLESTLLLFRNNTPVPLYLFRLKIAHQLKHYLLHWHSSGLSVALCKIGRFLLQVNFFNAWWQL